MQVDDDRIADARAVIREVVGSVTAERAQLYADVASRRDRECAAHGAGVALLARDVEVAELRDVDVPPCHREQRRGIRREWPGRQVELEPAVHALAVECGWTNEHPQLQVARVDVGQPGFLLVSAGRRAVVVLDLEQLRHRVGRVGVDDFGITEQRPPHPQAHLIGADARRFDSRLLRGDPAPERERRRRILTGVVRRLADLRPAAAGVCQADSKLVCPAVTERNGAGVHHLVGGRCRVRNAADRLVVFALDDERATGPARVIRGNPELLAERPSGGPGPELTVDTAEIEGAQHEVFRVAPRRANARRCCPLYARRPGIRGHRVAPRPARCRPD